MTCRPIAVTVTAAAVLSSVGAFPGRIAPVIVPTETYSVQLQAAVSDLAFNTTALVKTATPSPTAAATVASAVGPSEILAVLSNVVTAAVTVVGAAAWFTAFPITLPVSYIVAQGLLSDPLLSPLGLVLGTLGPGGTGLVAFFGLPFLAVSIAVGDILRPLQNFQAAALAAPRTAAARRTPTASAATRPAARTIGTPRAAARKPVTRATAAESTDAAPSRWANKPAAAHGRTTIAKHSAAQIRQATPR
jgi:hypothetical protein